MTSRTPCAERVEDGCSVCGIPIKEHPDTDACALLDEAVTAERAERARIRRSFVNAFMNHPTGRMNDMEVLAVLDHLS